MFWSLSYLVLRRLLQLAVLRFRSNEFTELEIVVLRHELAVLRRQLARRALSPSDRVFFAAASRLLPRRRWTAFFVTPETLVRWHCQLVARRGTTRARDRAALASPARSASSYCAWRARTCAGAISGSPGSSPGSGSRYACCACSSTTTTDIARTGRLASPPQVPTHPRCIP